MVRKLAESINQSKEWELSYLPHMATPGLAMQRGARPAWWVKRNLRARNENKRLILFAIYFRSEAQFGVTSRLKKKDSLPMSTNKPILPAAGAAFSVNVSTSVRLTATVRRVPSISFLRLVHSWCRSQSWPE